MRHCHRLWKIAEFEEIVDIPVLQIEFVWFSGSDLSSFCCGMERCTLIVFFGFGGEHVGRRFSFFFNQHVREKDCGED